MTSVSGSSWKRGAARWASFLSAAALLAMQLQASSAAEAAQKLDLQSITPDAALGARLPDRIKKAGVLVVGSDTSYAPWEYLSAQDGRTPEGIDVDIAEALSRKLDLRLDFQTAQFASILPGLGTKYDLGISAFTITKERIKAVDFVSYFQSVNLWVVKSGNPSRFDPLDICGRGIAVQTGSAEETLVRQASDTCVQQGKHALNLLPFETVDQCFTRVAAGGVDALIAGSSVAGYAVTQSGGALETLPAPAALADHALDGIAVAKSDAALSAVVAAAINALMADGIYARIFEKWGVNDVGISRAEINPEK